MAKQFKTTLQDLVYNVDVGIGLRLIQVGLYILFIGIALAVYTATQFFTFDDPEAMELAQLGRNFSETGELRTMVVRPATIRFLIENKETTVTAAAETGGEGEGETTKAEEKVKTRGGNPRFNDHPDIIHPPLYPVALAGWFKMLGVEFDTDTEGGKYGPELKLIWLSNLFTVLSGILVWLLGRFLFDNRIGVLSMTIFFLSNYVLATSISGTNVSMTLFLFLAATYCLLNLVRIREDRGQRWKWVLNLVLFSLFSAMMVLTRYGSIVVIPGFVLYLCLATVRRPWIMAAAFLVLFTAAITPWLIRNNQVSGSPFGFALNSVVVGTSAFPQTSYERTMAPALEDLEPKRLFRGVRSKWFSNVASFYNKNMWNLGDGILICFFFAAYLHRFVRRPVALWRWSVLVSMALLIFAAGFFGRTTMRLLILFWPFVILYGFAFITILVDRLQFRLAIQRMGITALVVLMSAAPLVIELMPPKKTYPYPPYLRPYIALVCDVLEEDETICTDMPWATAWYGSRNSLYLPQTLDEFYEINDYIQRVSSIYFTTLTRDQPFIRGLVNGYERTWFPIHQGRVPGDFPLTKGEVLLQGDQLILMDRDRFAERARKAR